MPETLSLFDEPQPELKVKLGNKLAELAAQKLFLGTSSWKYEGWLNQIYTPERYLLRGRFSQKRFEQECLAEYAETFPVVCGDFSFYQFPSPEFWHKLFSGVPRRLQFVFKVPEEITVYTFPKHPRYGGRAGSANSNFLRADLFQEAFLEPLMQYRDRVPVILFEFTAFARKVFDSPGEFAELMADFLPLLPNTFRYAIEVRNPEFLDTAYFEVLRKHGVAHVFNAWTRMPTLSEQMQHPDVFTTDFTVTRALLRAGRPYEEAVRLFSPYQSIQEPNEEVRSALRRLLARAQERREATYIFVNNRLEGNAPGTIEAITEGV
ncbi:MAG: DUF72 domain-containing protein [Acidobacteriaceae bacterium]|nr:DUF72 domain-containing protein [Acidobacteriaceae bacterium]